MASHHMPSWSIPAAASFLGMWIAMMAAMMLPSLVPMLRRYRGAVAPMRAARLGALTALVGAGYLGVWTVAGAAMYPLTTALAAIAMHRPLLASAAHIAGGVVILIAGAVQFTAWKAHHLACCRESPRGRTLPANASTAWAHGVGLGRHCVYSCGNLMAILLVFGMMDLRVMAAMTAAITIERLAPAGERVARAMGVGIMGAGLIVIARGTGL